MLPSNNRVKLNRAVLKDDSNPRTAPRRKPPSKSLPKCGGDLNPEESLTSRLVAWKDRSESTRRGRPTKKGPESLTRELALDGSVGPQREPNKSPTLCVKQRADVGGNPNGFAESDGCFSEALRNSHWDSQEVKYTSTQLKKMNKQQLKSSIFRPKLAKTENTTQKVNKDKYPTVTLCDVAKCCNPFNHNCSYMIPDCLKTKGVQCFKRNMQASFQLFPGCSVQPQRKRERSQRPPVENGVISKVISKRISQQCTSAESKISSTSTKRKSTTASLDTHGEGDCTSKLGFPSPVSYQAKSTNLDDSVRHNCLVGASVKENCIAKNSSDGSADSNKLCVTEMSLVHDNVDIKDPGSLTCARVREYLWKVKNSCARTDMLWPFEKGGPTLSPPAQSNSTIGSIQPLRGQSGNDVNNNSNPTDNEGISESDGILPSSFPVRYQKMNYNPTSSPPALELNCWESTTSHSVSNSSCPSPVPSPVLLLSSQHKRFTGLSLDAGKNKCQNSRVSLCSSLSLAPQNTSESTGSTRSSLLLSDGTHYSDEEQSLDRSPPILEPYYAADCCLHANNLCCTERSSLLCRTSKEHWNNLCFTLPPLLSPINSPKGILFRRSLPCQSLSSSEEEDNEKRKSDQGMMVQSFHVSQMVDDEDKTCELLEDVIPVRGASTVLHSFASCNRDTFISRESEVQTDCEEEAGRSIGTDSNALNLNLKNSFPSGDLTDDFSSSSDEGAGKASSDYGSPHSATDQSSDPETAQSNGDGTKSLPADSPRSGCFDEIMAYEHDVLLINVIRDDPELFDNLPKQSLLNLGPLRVSKGSKQTAKVDSRCVSLKANYLLEIPENSEMDDGIRRPWRPQCCGPSIKKDRNNHLNLVNPFKNVQMRSDSNNNHFPGGIERSQRFQTVNSTPIPSPLMSLETCQRATNSGNMVNLRLQKSNAYCRHYFSETKTCELKMCRFQHLPVKGDEKFCTETVARFIKIPICLHKAGAVYTGYYTNDVPGVYFCKPLLLALLWALLKADMVVEVFSILSVNLAYKIVPTHDFLLSLFCHVREKGPISFARDLLQLTFKMVDADLDLSLDYLDCIKNDPLFQHIVPSESLVSPISVAGDHKFTTAAFQEYLSLANSLVEMELCNKQEDWRHMGEIFSSIHWLNHHPNKVQDISRCIAIALLADGKNNHAVPFAAFAEAACPIESEENLIRSFSGRIGVSLILRYHKTNQWAQGRKVVELLSFFKVPYSTMKSLFGNEEDVSRCSLITVATEFFLQSGSVEVALKTLRDNQWFVSSGPWPCERVDVEKRTRLLVSLLEKTSLRDSLEVLSNLPGMMESNVFVDTSSYCSLFNNHIKLCVERQTLPVAADTVDFMLCKKVPVKDALLQMLLHKLGKMNMWPRARELFRHSLNVGYYSRVSAPPGFSTLNVPCWLCEVELALSFEMFITFNATTVMNHTKTSTSQLSITLKRTQSNESKYLSSGSHLLAAAGVLQPKIIIHYTAVNSSMEQIFTVEMTSAQRWLSHNHLWAQELWTH